MIVNSLSYVNQILKITVYPMRAHLADLSGDLFIIQVT